MAELFIKRMRASEMVYEHKKEFGLPILDEKRENEVIKKNSEIVKDDVFHTPKKDSSKINGEWNTQLIKDVRAVTAKAMNKSSEAITFSTNYSFVTFNSDNDMIIFESENNY